MNYLNKFGSIVNKGVNNIKNKLDKNEPSLDQNQTDFAPSGMQIPDDEMPAFPQQPKIETLDQDPQQSRPQQNPEEKGKKKISIAAFLGGESKSPSQANRPQNNIVLPNNSIQTAPPTSSSSRNKTQDSKPSIEFMKDFKLIQGETPIEWDTCKLIDNIDLETKVLLTDFRLIWYPNFNKTSLPNRYQELYPNDYFSIPIHMIYSIDRASDKIYLLKQTINIITKDNRKMWLSFNSGQNDGFYNRWERLIQLKETPSYSSFAIKYNSNCSRKGVEDGWYLYSPEKEYARQGVTHLDTEPNKHNYLRWTKWNEDYRLCDSYPKYLIEPSEITDDEIRLASAFRTKSRIPSLAYYYPPNNGTIWRSSQTKSGLTNARNTYDEKLIGAMASMSKEKKITIFDARPYLSACANKLKGAGFENVDNYPQAEIVFCEVDHIHAARSALKKIYMMIGSNKFSENRKFYSSFESSNWGDFVFMIIKTCIKIAYTVKSGRTVHIHCSDGWDRASQLTAFSELLVDPYFRTIKGYMILIEKDFLSFGHQFKIRNGYYNKKEYNDDQNSPILLQFLDATHQWLVQFPMYFEFNMEFLLYIANNWSSGRYGTFWYSSDREREMKEAKKNTMSIWTDMLIDKEKYSNPFYNRDTREHFFFIPNFSNNKIRFWEEYFLQYNQLSLGLNYHKYTMQYNNGCTDNRILSNVMFMNNEKIKGNKIEKELNDMKNLIKELQENGVLNESIVLGLSKESQEALKMLNKSTGNTQTWVSEVCVKPEIIIDDIEIPKIEVKENEEERLDDIKNENCVIENETKEEVKEDETNNNSNNNNHIMTNGDVQNDNEKEMLKDMITNS